MSYAKTLARPYAKAIFDLAPRDVDEQKQWQDFLNVAAGVIAAPEIVPHLRRPDFINQIQHWIGEWLEQHGGRKLSQAEINLLQELDKQGKLTVIPEIAEHFLQLCTASQNAVVAKITSAKSLSEEEIALLQKTLASKLDKTVTVDVEEDATLLAGVVIEYDGQVTDQSLKGRLAMFARKLDD